MNDQNLAQLLQEYKTAKENIAPDNLWACFLLAGQIADELARRGIAVPAVTPGVDPAVPQAERERRILKALKAYFFEAVEQSRKYAIVVNEQMKSEGRVPVGYLQRRLASAPCFVGQPNSVKKAIDIMIDNGIFSWPENEHSFAVLQCTEKAKSIILGKT